MLIESGGKIVTREEIKGQLIAGVYAFRHEPDKAFEWLDRAYVQHDTGLAATKSEPLLKNLHGDPRYVALLKKLRLPL